MIGICASKWIDVTVAVIRAVWTATVAGDGSPVDVLDEEAAVVD
jgi:hypothetical protein